MANGSDIRAITTLKTQAAAVVDDVVRTRRPVIITQHGEARAVLMDVASYRELREAALMLKVIAVGESDVRKGRTSPQEAVFGRMEKRVARKSR